MNKYKLVNTATKEEHICEKVVIEEYDYYVCLGKPKIGECYILDGVMFRHNSSEEDIERLYNKNFLYIIVATNNHVRNFKEFPKVIDEVHVLALKNADKEDWDFHSAEDCGYYDHVEGFKNGYNESQATHSNSDEDMIEFAKFAKSYKSSRNVAVAFKMWKSKQIKTIYYE